MGSRIYTRTGDSGTTSLFDGTRVPKHSPRVEAYGTIDEVDACLGAALAFCDDPLLSRVLEFTGHRLYNCSSITAMPPGDPTSAAAMSADDVIFLERAIDRFEEKAGAILGFVLPGGGRVASLLHVARTVCRRAERALWALAEDEHVDRTVLAFVNRCSDLLFAAARYANAAEGRGDVHWNPTFPPPDID